MKYFIAHLLKGDAREYHNRLTHELTERFNTTPLYEKVDPHITVKIPFEANNYELAQLESMLTTFSHFTRPEPLLFEGFGRFGFRTVYMDVVKSRGAVELVRECLKDLQGLHWMQQSPHEGNKLHASVARFMTHRKFRKVRRHLRHERPCFKQTLDNLVIMKKVPGQKKWEVHKEFELKLVPEQPTFKTAFGKKLYLASV